MADTLYFIEKKSSTIVVTSGNSIDERFTVKLNSKFENLTGTLRMIIRKPNGSILMDLRSTGESPSLSITGHTFRIVIAKPGFESRGEFPFELKYSSDETEVTIWDGKFIAR